ncbi:ABA 3 protein [Phlyctema vagabunda]|uniref:ABA 3 protein n=1 Tax=Phlyctema vagabunda TaxID=108571 RepID=A0ABR4P7D5_9HELO
MREAAGFLKTHDQWYYPSELANDLHDVNIPEVVKKEVLACAWEYARSVIPQYTNWARYIAFMRTIVMSIIAEFRGNLIDIAAGDNVLGYNVLVVLDTLFRGTPGHEAMSREYRTNLLITAEKTSERRNGELFRRYVNGLSRSPRQWFRMRDADALARFTIASALACNNLDEVWFTDEQFEILTEIGDTLYDAVAFFKHRAEGETNNTFAYMPAQLRIQAFRQARQLLWALDVAWAVRQELQVVANFVRLLGGPIHMMMRRYRFVEDDLTIGIPETDDIVSQARCNVKLWNRMDTDGEKAKDLQRYKDVMARSDILMYPGLAESLDNEDNPCSDCRFRETYGAESRHQFGGVEICHACKEEWRAYFDILLERAAKAFPELASVLKLSGQ